MLTQEGQAAVEKCIRMMSATRPMGAAREIVLSLLIDDGVPGRGHRRVTPTAGYGEVGLSIGMHKSYGKVCVIDFAQ